MEDDKKMVNQEGSGGKDENGGGAGQEEQQGNQQQNGGNGSGPEGGTASSKTFTQEQVNKMMTREKVQGKNSVYRELGIDPKDAKTIELVKSYLQSQKTDEQKAEEAANESNRRVLDAEHRALVAEVKAEAMVLGIRTQYIDDIVTLVMSKQNDDDAEFDIKGAVSEYKTKYPGWFSTGDDEGKNTGKRGTGSTIKGKDTKAGTNGGKEGLGARLAAQRKSGIKRTSYWGNNK